MPEVIVLGGPNGSGKSTAAGYLLPRGTTFLNADDIAKGLSEASSRTIDRLAGQMILQQMNDLGSRGADFAVETTLAGRSLATRIRRLKASGYRFNLMFLWLPSPDLAVARVAERVRNGGHNIPEETIRRRYSAGIRNFFELFRPSADLWRVYDTSGSGFPILLAEGRMGGRELILVPSLWQLLCGGSKGE
jgi:predicted ABC-type ATPase